jgi:hypothetical protein
MLIYLFIYLFLPVLYLGSEPLNGLFLLIFFFFLTKHSPATSNKNNPNEASTTIDYGKLPRFSTLITTHHNLSNLRYTLSPRNPSNLCRTTGGARREMGAIYSEKETSEK